MEAEQTDLLRRRWVAAGLAGGGLALPAARALAASVAGARRVALVVGNAAYPAAPLRNAVNDAVAMSRALSDLGFRVVLVQDADKAGMQAAIARAREMLEGQAGVGLFFYAGHAIQLDWRNFLLPVDANPVDAAEVPRHAVDVEAVIGAFRAAGSRINIVVLDACRDNPFGSAAGGAGLAPMDAPPGTYLAYATAPGHTADDGAAAAGNGLYTRYLLEEIGRADARIEDVFKRVRLQVRRASAGRQVPWESTSLEDDFYFASGDRVPAPTTAVRDAALDDERAHWQRIRSSARAEDFYEYLQRFPNGALSELAQFRLDQLAAAVAPTVLPGGVPALPPGADRYRLGELFERRVTDRLKGNRQRLQTWRVTSIEGSRVLFNGGEITLDQMGSMIRGYGEENDPPALVTPADMQVGKRWRSVYWSRRRGEPASRRWRQFRVVALEPVSVPAGRFQAYRVAVEGESVAPTWFSRIAQTRWVDVATLTDLRRETRVTSERGVVTEDQVDELMRMTRVART